MNLNKVFLIGRITANPEIRKTPSGQSVTSFTVATNRIWTSKTGSRQQETEFHNVVVWGRQAEIATQFLTKGNIVFIEGRLKTRNWQGKDGITRYVTEIICERLQLGPRSGIVQTSSNDSDVNQSIDNDFISDLSIGGIGESSEVPIIDINEEKVEEEDLPF